jgi:sulfur carrier protein ThiS adenylyltransferase
MNEFENGLRRYLNEKDLLLIRSIKIGIGGAGGLGSNIANILVRCGFRNIEIFDLDTVQASNLNRQIFNIDDIGKPKVLALKDHLLKINPDLNMTVHQLEWTANGPGTALFHDRDIIVEAFDAAASKRDFVEFYHDKAKFIVSGNGMAGTQRTEPLRTSVRGNIFFIGDGVSDINEGLPPMSPRVTACAALMAEKVLDLVLSGKVLKTGEHQS